MIIDCEELEVWMIALLNHPKTHEIRDISLKSWKDQGFTVNLFNAITPDDIPNLKVKLDLTRKEKIQEYGGPVIMSETEKAIWYSQYFMWEKCIELNKPICIIEEDCQLIRKLPEFFFIYKMIAFCYNHKDISPAAGYIITPQTAKSLCGFALNERLEFNVDHHLAKYMDEKNPRIYAKQIERNWSTIEHW